MNSLPFDQVPVGFELPPLTLPAINRTTLALYAGASGDHNQVHIDLDFARKARLPDVFAHGMLSVAYLGRLLTAWVAQTQIRSLAVRFTGITQLGHIPTCHGKVVELLTIDGEPRARLEIRCVNQYGYQKLLGEATVALT